MPASARTIAVANGKGGVGKTTTTAHMGALAAEAGNRVLLVELDVQGNLGEDLGYTGAGLSDEGEALYTAVRSGKPPVPLREVRPNLDVVPGGAAVSLIPSALDAYRRSGRESTGAVARCLAPLAADYDLVFIDTPPIDAVVQEEALVAAAYLLIPTKTDASSRKGLREMAQRFAAARAINPTLTLLGVFLFGVTSGATRIRSAARAAIQAELGAAAPVFEATIRHVEAAAYDVRERGQLAHELERVVDAGPKWYERLRDGSGVDAPQLASSSASLAGDFQALTAETLAALVRAETAAAAVTA
jgi:cellulose biosynthesis protein BcsQ